MDTRSSSLVVVLYLIGAITVAGVMYYAYDRVTRVTRVEDEIREQLNVEPTTTRVARVPLRGTFAAATRPSHELYTSLAVTREQLERRTTDLHRKDAECQALKEELDASFALIATLLSEQPSDANNKSARAKLEAELTRLQGAIERSEAMSFQQEQELGYLQSQLIQGSLALENYQDEAKRQIEALVLERESLDAAAMRVIERSGMTAVPGLIESLMNENPNVRKWAALCLGRLGMDAADAQLDLRELLNDPDAAVRAEAQRALALINSSEIN